jgi:hypothetical protein
VRIYLHQNTNNPPWTSARAVLSLVAEEEPLLILGFIAGVFKAPWWGLLILLGAVMVISMIGWDLTMTNRRQLGLEQFSSNAGFGAALIDAALTALAYAVGRGARIAWAKIRA